VAPVSGLRAALNQRVDIEDYLVLSTVLSVMLFVPLLPSIQLGYVIAIFNSLLLLALNRLSIHRNHLLAILAIAAFSVVGTRVSGVSSTVIFAQILGITVMSVYYLSILTSLDLPPKRWMEIYVWLALAVAILGIALWPLEVLYDDGRLKSIYSEPSFYIYVTLPAVGYCFNAYASSRRYGPELLIFVLSYGLAKSSLGYLGLMLAALFVFASWLRGWKVFAAAILLAIAAAGVYLASSDVRLRVNQMAGAMVRQDLVGVGASPFAFLSNVYVTSQSFAAHPWVGSGIGSYSNLYDRYIGDISGFGLAPLLELELNKYDANSMILRVAAELGLPGLIILFGFMIVCARVKGSPYREIRNAILPYLLVRTARLGAYFTVELYFFVGIYLLNYLNYRKTSRKVPATAASLPYAGQPEPI
jgi:O-antigen ligase